MTSFESPVLTACKQVRCGMWIGPVLLAATTLLTGCSGMSFDGPAASVAGVALQGNVHGGQQPVSGATIQLYAAQATGYGATSQALILSSVTSDGQGNFTITGDYTCPASPNDQVYLVATGGNPGGGNNSNLSLMAALGSCSALTGSTFINVNEVTTVASVYALAGFMSDYQHVATSSTNYTGLKSAFATVNNLVNTATGQALAVTPAYVSAPTGTTAKTFASVVPQAEIFTLANIIASCVNTTSVGGTSTGCTNLFGAARPPGGTLPADTIQATLDIAQHPGNNVSTLFSYSTSSPPFSPALSTAPNDWTIALNFIGGGLGGINGTTDSGSTGLAIDGSGNLWITNTRRSTLTELNNLGAPVSLSTVTTPSVTLGGFSGGGLNSSSGIAADLLGNVWIGNSDGTVSEFTSGGIPIGTGFTGGGSTGPGLGVAIDGFNNVWVTSPAALSEFNSSGVAYPSSPYTPDVNVPTGAIAVDGSENVFIANGGNGFVDKFGQNGGLLGNSVNIVSNGGAYGAIDGTGQFWEPEPSNVRVYGTNAAWTGANYFATSLSSPTGVAIDGADHVWIASLGGVGGQAANANITELTITGTVLSPGSTGFTGTGTLAGTGMIAQPQAAAIDASGNLWVVNGQLSSSLTEFVGIAAPTYTPLAAAVKNNAIGKMP